MTTLITFFLVALVFSFLCSLWEAVLLSVTPTYAQGQIETGSGVGRQLKLFKDNIDRPLAAILTLNTIAHTVGAIGVGAQANRLWAETHPVLNTVVIPIVMTLGILVFSEIVPKTIGANSWQRLTPFTVRSLQALTKLLAPLVWMSQIVTKKLKRDESAPVLTRADFLAMATLGKREGVIEEHESTIIASLLRFRTVRIADIMTPRTVMLMAAAEQTIDQFVSDDTYRRFTRIPLYQDGDKERIETFVLKADLLSAIVEGRGSDPLQSVARKLPVLPKTAIVAQLLDRLLDERLHIALVVDEFGDVSGLVTMEDIIETLLDTEIVDELDQTEDMQAYARRLWRRRAAKLGLEVAED